MVIQRTGEHAEIDTNQAGAIRVTGDVERDLTLTLDSLRAYPSTRCEPFDLCCYTTKRFIRTVDSYRGVLLTELIRHAGLRCVEPGDFKRTMFLAVAHDGYSVTFSWHELFNTPIGAQAIIAYECGGKALEIEDGAPILFSGADTVPAPRHVKRIARLEARVVAP